MVEAGLAMPLLVLFRPLAKVRRRRDAQLAGELNYDETLVQGASSGKNHQALVWVEPALEVDLVAGGADWTLMCPNKATALGYQPTPGNQLKNHSEEIATARPKPGHTESLCIDAGEVLLCDMVKVLVLKSDRLSFADATFITTL